MVIRVVLAVALAAMAVPAHSAEPPRLPYDIANFFAITEARPQMPYALDRLLFDRVPDHVALAYRLDGLIGAAPVPLLPPRNPDGSLDYELEGLVDRRQAEPGAPAILAAAP